jgi:hypothetical protein
MNIYIGTGWPNALSMLQLSAQHKYQPEEIEMLIKKKTPKKIFLILDNCKIQLKNQTEQQLGYKIASIFHNSVCGHDNQRMDLE